MGGCPGLVFVRTHTASTGTRVMSVEEQRGIGGNITIKLDNGAFVGLIYSLLVLS